MEILANVGDWTQTDEESLAAFLETPTGLRLIPTLVKNTPSLLAGGEINAILIRSGEVRAFQSAIETLWVLAHPPESTTTPATTLYPALENDKAWNDGQTLDVPKPENPQTLS